MEIEHMEFEVEPMTGNNDLSTLVVAMRTVDPDAKVDVNVNARTVMVDSWLLPEEFLIAFEEAGYKVKISKG